VLRRRLGALTAGAGPFARQGGSCGWEAWSSAPNAATLRPKAACACPVHPHPRAHHAAGMAKSVAMVAKAGPRRRENAGAIGFPVSFSRTPASTHAIPSTPRRALTPPRAGSARAGSRSAATATFRSRGRPVLTSLTSMATSAAARRVRGEARRRRWTPTPPRRPPPAPRSAPPPPLPRTNRTSLVPPLVLSGHAASLNQGIKLATAHSELSSPASSPLAAASPARRREPRASDEPAQRAPLFPPAPRRGARGAALAPGPHACPSGGASSPQQGGSLVESLSPGASPDKAPPGRAHPPGNPAAGPATSSLERTEVRPKTPARARPPPSLPRRARWGR